MACSRQIFFGCLFMKNKVVTALAAVTFAGTAAAGDNDLVIEITSGLPQVKNEVQSKTTMVQASPTTDGGDLITSLPGVSGVRIGGRAIDPIIRGQSQTQLNILLDGAYLHGAGPNRMDPPTAYTSVDSYDQVTVIKGNRSVIYGSGGPGGTVLFQRSWPTFDESGVSGDVSASYHGNGDRHELGADIAAGNDKGYVRFITHDASANNYEDGDGNKVRSSYDSKSNTLLAGWLLSDYTKLDASVEQAREDDVLFAGAGMDGVYADADIARLKLTHQFQSKVWQQMVLEVYQAKADHLMDNFSLRPVGMMLMQARTSSDTDGARLVFDARMMDIDWQFGFDLQNNDRDGEVRDGSKAPLRLLWPGAEIDQNGLFVEAEKSLGVDDVIKGGLRYDHVTAVANRRDELVNGMMPLSSQQIWTMAGAPAGAGEKKTEDNVGGFASWTHRLNDEYSVDTVLSRTVRTADATERYIARVMMTGDWIGNPELDPEKHHQIEISLQNQQENLNWNLSAWYNRVDDYILRDTVSAGMKDRDIYRNISAELYGAELEMTYRLNDGWRLGNTLTWTVGNNLDDDTSLSRISPLEFTSSLDYTQDKYAVGVNLRLVAAQNDVCISGSADCGGQDVRKTPGYGVVDLHGQYDFAGGVTLLAGVDNLLDKAYALHESRDDAVNPAPFQVAEPGRSIWMRVSKAF